MSTKTLVLVSIIFAGQAYADYGLRCGGTDWRNQFQYYSIVDIGNGAEVYLEQEDTLGGSSFSYTTLKLDKSTETEYTYTQTHTMPWGDTMKTTIIKFIVSRKAHYIKKLDQSGKTVYDDYKECAVVSPIDRYRILDLGKQADRQLKRRTQAHKEKLEAKAEKSKQHDEIKF